MANVRQEAEFGAPVEDVWKLVGDFVGLIEFMGFRVEVEGRGIGALRKVTVDGHLLAERLEERDEEKRLVRYSMPVSGPLPLANYVATMQLDAAGPRRSRLVWTSTFEPKGATEDVAITTVRGIYQNVIAALQGRYGA